MPEQVYQEISPGSPPRSRKTLRGVKAEEVLRILRRLERDDTAKRPTV